MRSSAAVGVEMADFDLDGLGVVLGEDGFLSGGVEAGTVGEVGPEGVAWEEGFAEGDELAALAGGLADVGGDFGEDGLGVEVARGDLGEAEGEEVGVGGGHGAFVGVRRERMAGIGWRTWIRSPASEGNGFFSFD